MHLAHYKFMIWYDDMIWYTVHMYLICWVLKRIGIARSFVQAKKNYKHVPQWKQTRDMAQITPEL